MMTSSITICCPTPTPAGVAQPTVQIRRLPRDEKIGGEQSGSRDKLLRFVSVAWWSWLSREGAANLSFA
jgi:hypothetical protein